MLPESDVQHVMHERDQDGLHLVCWDGFAQRWRAFVSPLTSAVWDIPRSEGDDQVPSFTQQHADMVMRRFQYCGTLDPHSVVITPPAALMGCNTLEALGIIEGGSEAHRQLAYDLVRKFAVCHSCGRYLPDDPLLHATGPFTCFGCHEEFDMASTHVGVVLRGD
jgi:hypothetical protein